MDGGGDDGDDVLYEGGVRRRLMSSSPSLSSSTSQRLFLVRLAGGETGSGVSSECCSLAAGAMTYGSGQAATMQRDIACDSSDVCERSLLLLVSESGRKG
jgi:hypothetical protein